MKKMKSFLTMFMVAALIVSCIPAAAFAAETGTVYETEPNDVRSKGTVLAPNQQGIGAIEERDSFEGYDVDYYKCVIPADGYVTIQFDVASSDTEIEQIGTGWDIELFKNDDNNARFKNEYGIKTAMETPKYPVKKGDMLYLKVEMHDSYKAPYDTEYAVVFNCVADTNWEDEENGSRSKATLLKDEVKMYGNLQDYNDEDYWKYTFKDNGKISFKFQKDSFDVEDVGYGWDVDILAGDSSDVLYSVCVKGNAFESPDFAFKKGTTVYIKVSQHDSYDDPEGIDYRITLDALKSTKWENENNDTSKKARTLTGNTKYNGNMSSYEDVDYFKIKAAKKGKMNIYFGKNSIDDDLSYGWNVIVKVNGNTVKTFENVKNLYQASSRIGYVNVKKGQTVTVEVVPYSTYYSPTNVNYALKCKNV